MSTPIIEPELNFLPHACECGAVCATKRDLELHVAQLCPRKTRRLPFFEIPGHGGVADGGRKT